MEQRYQQLRRATVARSALDVIAIVFLGCGIAFWGVAFWQMLGPPALLSLMSIQALVLALAFSLAAPLLLSMLVPTTPAGQLLQKTQWATIGFYVILASALFLVYQAEQLIELWLYAQPGVQEAHFERRLAIVLVIAFVVVPALAWIQLTPERWVATVQQAHKVKKLEMQQRGELAIIKASLLRAESLAAIGWANLLPLEREEAVKSLRGLLMASSDTMRGIVRTLGISADLERSIMGDDEIAAEMDYVTQSIDVLPELAPPARTEDTRVNAPAPVRAPSSSGSAERAPAAYTKPHDDRVDVRVAVRQGDTARDANYTIAYEAFGLDQAWTVRDLAGVLKVADSTARERKIIWEAARLVSGTGLSNGRYRFID